MNKPSSLTLAVCFALAACTPAKQKSAWQQVRETKPDKVAANSDPTEAYRTKLHKVLAENKVEHKLVTYQYRYKTRMREDALGTQTAVIYKDNSDPENPWWLVNERTGRPVWLPGQDVNKQVAFYLRRKAEVLEQKEFSGGEPSHTEMVAKHTPPAPIVPTESSSATQIAKVRRAPAPAPARETLVAHTAPAPAPAAETTFVRPARFSGSSREVPIPFTAPARPDAELDDQFRRAHGTEYDPASAIDREKMEALKHARLETREPSGTRTF
ncbi:MAG: hypothetical protein K8R23_03545 [Chthoniobacter sp.]|nr:hypothetical protein [Chthoniobacter sp.]